MLTICQKLANNVVLTLTLAPVIDLFFWTRGNVQLSTMGKSIMIEEYADQCWHNPKPSFQSVFFLFRRWSSWHQLWQMTVPNKRIWRPSWLLCPLYCRWTEWVRFLILAILYKRIDVHLFQMPSWRINSF